MFVNKSTIIPLAVTDTPPRPSSKPTSFTHLLAVWLLVGSSFFGLGLRLVQATLGYEGWTVGTLTLSGWDVGLLLAAVVVSAAWVAGLRPSLRVALAYFLVESVVHLLVALALSWAGVAPWATVAARAVSIPVAAVGCLTPQGRTAVKSALAWLRARTRQVLQVPTE